MPEDLRLPIKVVVPVATDFQPPHAGGGKRKSFGDVTPQLRSRLVDEVQVLPVVARVILKGKALAKSHRPSALFSEATCPIIGGRNFGELLISIRQGALDRLFQKLREDDTATGMADISTIERIEPFRAEDAMKMTDQGQAALQHNGTIDLKFRLFRHMKTDLDEIIYRAFQELLHAMDLGSEPLRYAEGQRIFRVKDVPRAGVAALSSFVGTQALSDFPLYRAVRTEAIPLREAEIADFPAPNPRENYPVVGIVDSGVNPNDPLMAPWMVARYQMQLHVAANDPSSATRPARGHACNQSAMAGLGAAAHG